MADVFYHDFYIDVAWWWLLGPAVLVVLFTVWLIRRKRG